MSDHKETSTAAPLFSFGVTTYDRVELLVQTLASILGQTFSDFEVIVGNDNPDRILSGEILGIHDSRVRFVNHSHNLGELGNMNALLGLARGRYFTWIADDDLYAPNFLQAVHSALNKFDFPPCVYTSYVLGSAIPEVTNEGEQRLYRGREFLRLYLAGALKAIGTMGMFDREYLLQMGGLEDLAGVRVALYSEYLHLIKTGLLEKIAYVDTPFVIYRDHRGSWGCSLSDKDLFKHAGENLSRRSMEIFRRPELVQDFNHNITRYLQRFMSEFIEVTRARHPESLNDREVLEYLIFSRRYVSSLKWSALYWRAILCLVKIDAKILWPICKRQLISHAPSRVRKIASFMRARFRRNKLSESSQARI
jgi:glycosyltransferase involved in cell wall biosynthesis